MCNDGSGEQNGIQDRNARAEYPHVVLMSEEERLERMGGVFIAKHRRRYQGRHCGTKLTQHDNLGNWSQQGPCSIWVCLLASAV